MIKEENVNNLNFDSSSRMIADLVKFGSEGQDDREGMNWKRNETKIRWNLP